MKFSEAWLREWIDPKLTSVQLGECLTASGLEVDAIESVANTVNGVVVGHITSVTAHPNADKLRICEVDIGLESPLTIVCGAPEVKVGWYVPTACIGATLSKLTIKKTKLRGIESQGMLCSRSELGLDDRSAGLMILDTDAIPGQNIMDYLKLNDVSIELGLTPNRSDCLGMIGIAREIGVITKSKVKALDIKSNKALIQDSLKIRIDVEMDCPRYAGRIITNIDANRKTPIWMQEKLRRGGIRCLSSVIDVTNYVMLELGQPMHAFDLESLQGNICVRKAQTNESLVLLNGQTIILDSDSLVIADDNKALALAGIMGGEKSSVKVTSTAIFLESAFFNPEAISGRARKYGLHTDSSHRFERGVDPSLQIKAIERATTLLIDIVGGNPGPVVEKSSSKFIPVRSVIHLRWSRITQILGIKIAVGEIDDILRRLGMEVRNIEGGWNIIPPSFRFDIQLEIDLIEEIARIFGYQNIPSTPSYSTQVMQCHRESEISPQEFRYALIERGYQEAITFSFVEPKLQAMISTDIESIALANPISQDLSVMRTSLWPGLLQALKHNQSRQHNRVRLFESGLRFYNQDDILKQEMTLSGVVCGLLYPEQWGLDKRLVNFYDIKSDVEVLLAKAGVGQAEFRIVKHDALHPGQSAGIYHEDQHLGWIGAIHPTILESLNIDGPIFVFELFQSKMIEKPLPKFQAISRFPSVRRDLSIVVDDTITFSIVREIIFEKAPINLISVQLFDVFTGKSIDSGRKSLALGLTFQDLKRTLNDKEIELWITNILKQLNNKIGATLRS